MDEEVFTQFEAFDFDNNRNFQNGWSAIAKVVEPERKVFQYLKARAFFYSKNVRQFDLEQYLLWRKNKHGEEGELGIPDSGKSGGSPDKLETRDSKKSGVSSSSSSAAAASSTHSNISATGSPSLKAQSHSIQDENDVITQGMKVLSDMGKPKTSGGGECDEAGVKSGSSGNVDNSDTVSDKQAIEQQNESPSEQHLSLAELADLLQNNAPIPGIIAVDVKPTNTDPTPSVMDRRSKPWEANRQNDKVSSLSELISTDSSDAIS